MTLTIEELKYGAEVGDLGIDAVRAVCAEALANREAQPVLYASEETLAYAKDGEKSLVTWSEPMGDAVIPLYPAPPALAAFPEAKDKSQGWKIDPEYLHAIADAVGSSDDEGTPSMELVEAVLLAAVPPAPEVPDIKIKKALLWLDGIIQSNPGMKEALTCRAAMLKASE